MAEYMRQTTRADSALPCKLHWVRIRNTERSATLCTFFILLLFLRFLNLFTITRHYFALILQYGVAGCLFQQFFAKHNFDHFDLILFKRLFCEILFSDFAYLLLDHITNGFQNTQITNVFIIVSKKRIRIL